MSVPATSLFNIEKLRRYDGPGWFLGAGVLVGLLFFMVWLHSRPDEGRHALRARGNGVVGMNAPDEGAGGVLGDITGGELRPGAAKLSSSGEDFFHGETDSESETQDGLTDDGTLAPDQQFDQSVVQDADAMAVGEDVGAPPDAQGALTDSLLGPPPDAAPAAQPGEDAPSAPGSYLRSWYVEVEVAPGQVQMLQLNAESPEHALAILRDFRGNPRVVRGPSPEPLP
jgi:hypothetical protein